MNIKKSFGKHIYKLTIKNPIRTRKQLAFVYSGAGLLCKYFPSKKLLPAREYMQWAAADSAIKPFRDGKGAAIVSLYMPCEILHAMGIKLMFPEGLAGYLAAAKSERIFIETAENNGIPNTMCSYHKSFIGMVESGVLPKPDFVINTTLACDANHLSFRRAAEYYTVPQFVVDVPSTFSDANVDYVAGQLRDLVTFIEKNSQFKLDENKLKESIKHSKRTIENFRKIIEVRREKTLSDVMTSHMLSLYATHILLGTEEAEKYSADLLKQLGECPPSGSKVRLMWVHTLPYCQDALCNLVNFSDRCEIVGCDVSFDAVNANTNEEDPYLFMAQRLLKNTANGPGKNRIEAVYNLAVDLKADGVVWFCHWGCKQTAGASAIAKKFLESKGIPTLILDGDGCDSNNVNDGQTVTRMEAFLEILENKK